MGKAWCLFTLVFLAGVTASAQDASRGDAFFGYSYIRANPGTISGVPSFNMNGGTASASFNVGHSFGVVGEFSGTTVGSIGGGPASGTLFTYLGGPRFSYRHSNRLVPYAQALFGGAHTSGGSFGGTASPNAFAMAVGGGVDAKVSQHLAVRLGQLDYLLTRFDDSGTGRTTQNNLRYSAGIVFRW